VALDFLFLYEHIVREFDNDALIMAELKRRGYSVELMQLMDRKKLKYFTCKKPKVIVTSAMYDNETLNSFVYNNVGKLDKVVNLHWEEVLSREQELSDFYNMKQNAAKCTHICWGNEARNRIIKGGVPENNAVVTGAVQLDFVRNQFDGYYLTRDELCRKYGLDNSKKWLLYISSFSCAFMDDAEVAELNAMTDLDFAGFKAVGARSMTTTLEWFDRLLDENPDCQLIYRPHPSEWQSPPLDEMKRKHSNFVVISDYSVKQWVKCCDTVLTWMSTSLAEIYFSGKSCIVVRPEPLFDDYDPVIYEGVNACDSYEKLDAAIRSDEIPFPTDIEMLKSHYDFTEQPAYMRICDLLEQTYREPPRDRPFGEGFKPHFNALKFVVLIGLHIMDSLHINPMWFKFLIGENAAVKTQRLLGYIDKARLSRKQIDDKIAEMSTYLN